MCIASVILRQRRISVAAQVAYHILRCAQDDDNPRTVARDYTPAYLRKSSPMAFSRAVWAALVASKSVDAVGGS